MGKSSIIILFIGLFAVAMLANIGSAASIAIDLDTQQEGIQTTRNANIGDEFPIQIYVQDVTDLDSLDIELAFDRFDLIFDPDSIMQGSFLPQTESGFFRKDTSKPGVVSISYSLPGNDPNEAPDGSGVIAKANVKVIGGGQIPINVGKAWLFDSNRNLTDVTANSGASVITGPDPNAQKLLVEITPQTVQLGGTIDVAINIENAVNLDSYDFTVVYNPFRLQYVDGSAAQGSFLDTTVNGESFFKVDASSSGQVILSNALPGQDPLEAPDGNGTLATMKFNVVGGNQTETVGIENAKLFDPAKVAFQPTVVPGTFNIPRPTPGVAVDLNPQSAGIQDTINVGPGDVFTIDIVGIDLTNLNQFEFEIKYDPAMLDPDQGSLTEGAFFNGTSLQSDFSTPGTIGLLNTMPGADPLAAPDGTGPLASLSFKALTSGTTKITLDKIDFLDVEQQPINIPANLVGDGTVAVNDPPLPDFTYTPTQPMVGEKVTLDASGSTDSDGSITKYEWDLDGNGSYETTGITAETTFTTVGDHRVNLKVTDNRGYSSAMGKTINVLPLSPTVDIGGPYEANEGEAMNLSAQATNAAAIKWDLDNDGNYDDGEGATISHVFDDNGQYQIGVQAMDSIGRSVTDMTTVNVLNVPPTVDAGGPYTGTVGQPINFTGTAEDVQPDLETMVYEWDFNYDGTSFTTDQTGATPTWTYQSPGTFTAALRATDKDGGVSEIDLTSVTVSPPPNRPPSIDDIDDRVMKEGETISISIFASDPDGDPVSLTATGLPPNANFHEISPGVANFEYHPDFDSGGQSYTVTVEATDNGTPPLTDTETFTITVEDVVNDLVVDVNPKLLKGDGQATANVIARLISNGQPLPGANVVMSLSDGIGTLSQVMDNSDGTYSAIFTAGTQSGEALIIAEAPDQGVEAQVKVAVDADGPAISEITGDTIGTTGELVKITVVADDPTKPLSGTLSMRTGNRWTDIPIPVNSADPSVTIAVPSDSTDPIEYYVVVGDALGNTTRSPKTGVYTISVEDNDPPIADAGSDQIGTLAQPIYFSGSGKDNIGVALYEWDVDDSDGVDFTSPDLIGASPVFRGYGAFGVYTATLRVSDAAGNTDIDTVQITIPDNIPPRVTIDPLSSPINQDSVTVKGKVVRGEDGKPEVDADVDVTLNGVVAGSGKSADDGTFTVELTDLADGRYEVRAIATDAAGNRSDPANPRELIVDTAAPTILGLTPSDGAEVDTQKPVITALIVDALSPIQPSSVQMTLAAGGQVFAVNPYFDPLTGLLGYTPNQNLVNKATYTVEISAADTAGNTGVTSWSFKVDPFKGDNQPPKFSKFTPADGSTISDPQPLISVVVTEPNLSSFDELILEPETGDPLKLHTDSSFVFDPTTGLASATPPDKLPDGNYKIIAKATDKNDNVGTGTATFTVDTTPPEKPVIDHPASPTKTAKLTVTGSSEAGSKVSLFLDGKQVATVMADAGVFSTTVDLHEGMNILTAVAFDPLDNASDVSDPAKVLLDTRAPVISDLAPSGVIGTTKPEILASIRDPMSSAVSGVNPDSIQMTLNGDPITEFTYNAATGMLKYTPEELTDNTQYSFEVTAEDRAGNRSQSATASFFVNTGIADRTPPKVSFSVSEGETLTDNTPDISAILSDSETGIDEGSIAFFLDGSAVAFDYDSATGMAELKLETALADGDHSLRAIVSDLATPPNKTESTVNFSVKATVGTPILDSPPEYVGSPAVDISGMADPNVRVRVYVNNVPSGGANSDANGKFTVTNLPLIPGRNMITADAVDSFGNVSEKSDPVKVIYDNQAPVGSTFIPRDGARVNSVQAISVILSDSGSGVDESTILMTVDFVRVTPTFDGETVSYSPTAMSEGVHRVSLYVEDKVGNSAIWSWNFTLDQTPPVISKMVPSGTISNTYPLMSAVVSGDDIDWSSLIVKFDGQSVTDYQYDPVNGQVSYQTAVEDGNSYTFEVAVSDFAGNQGSGSTTFTVDTNRLDEEPPFFANQYPSPGSSINVTMLGVIVVVVLDNDSGVANIRVFINGQEIPIEQLGWGTMRGAASYNRQTGMLVLDVRQLQEGSPIQTGSNNIRVVAQDNQGNEDETEWDFNVIVDKPDKPVLDPVTSPTNLQSVEITGTAGANLTVDVMVNGIVAGSSTVGADGRFSVSGVLLVKGRNVITAYVTDAAGNQSDVSDPLNVDVDMTPPLVFPAISEAVNQPTQTVAGVVSEELASLDLLLNGTRQALDVVDLAFQTEITLGPGANTLVFEAVDLAGNKTVTDEYVVNLDNLPPQTPPSGLVGRIGLDGTSILLTWNNTPDANSYNLYRSKSPFEDVSSATLLASGIEGTKFRDGSVEIGRVYYYGVTPVDAAGNEGKTALSPNAAIALVNGASAFSLDYVGVASLNIEAGAISSDVNYRASVSMTDIPIDIPMMAIEGFGQVVSTFDLSVIGQDGTPVTDLNGKATLTVEYPESTDVTKFVPTLVKLVDGNWVAVADQAIVAPNSVVASLSGFSTYALVLVQAMRSFNLSLVAGLNLFSVPVNDPHIATIGDLLDRLGKARFLIRYDSERAKFDVLLPDSDKADDIPIDGSESYIASLTEPVTLELSGYAWSGKVKISEGVNLISMPVSPEEPMRISDMIAAFGDAVTALIWLDTSQNKFRSLLPATAADSPYNAVVQGGAGYLVVASKPAEATFRGEPWSSETVGAPLLARGTATNAPVLVVMGDLEVKSGVVSIVNRTKGISATTAISDGRFVSTLFSESVFHEVGDLIEIRTALDNGFDCQPIVRELTERDITNGLLEIHLKPEMIPGRTALLANYPNPFNPETWIPFQLKEKANVEITIFDMTGRVVRKIDLGTLDPGRYTNRARSAYWDGRNENGERVASGVYVYQLRAGSFVQSRRMVVLK